MVAIRKDAGESPKLVQIENSLEAVQQAVGGYVETVTFCSDAVLLCDEEGKIKNRPMNVKLFGEELVGTILIVGVNGDEFTDLKDPDNLCRFLFNCDLVVE